MKGKDGDEPLSEKDKKTLAALTRKLYDHQQRGRASSTAALYISELRWREKVSHPLNPLERVKTATNCDVYDFAPFAKPGALSKLLLRVEKRAAPRHLPLWERSEGGIFVGERGAGSGSEP